MKPGASQILVLDMVAKTRMHIIHTLADRSAYIERGMIIVVDSYIGVM